MLSALSTRRLDCRQHPMRIYLPEGRLTSWDVSEVAPLHGRGSLFRQSARFSRISPECAAHWFSAQASADLVSVTA